MRKVQHGLLQQRPGDESQGQRVSHGVFSVLGVQSTPPARRRVLPAGRRAAVSSRSRFAGGAGLCRKSAQPRPHPQQTAAHFRYQNLRAIIIIVINNNNNIIVVAAFIYRRHYFSC